MVILALIAVPFIGVRQSSPGILRREAKLAQKTEAEQSSADLCPNFFVKHTWKVPTEPAPTWIPIGGRFTPKPEHPTVTREQWTPKYCIIARTFAGQSPSINMFSIDRFVASFLMQTYPHWHLILLDTDPLHPYPYLYKNISEWANINEPFRIRIVNASKLEHDPRWDEPVTTSENDKENKRETLHGKVYGLTDVVIQKLCPVESTLFLTTNGDNWYHPRFLEEVEQHLLRAERSSRPVDILGVDFFSRYATYIWGVPQRERTCAAIQTYSPCVCNGIIPEKTDLGSMVFNLNKWRGLGLSFFNLSTDCYWGRSKADACAAFFLPRLYNWTVDRLPKCLFSHAPNPHICALYGGQTVLAPYRQEEQEFECVLSMETARVLVQEEITRVIIGNGAANCYQARRFLEENRAPQALYLDSPQFSPFTPRPPMEQQQEQQRQEQAADSSVRQMQPTGSDSSAI